MKSALKRTMLMLLVFMMVITFIPNLGGIGKVYAASSIWFKDGDFEYEVDAAGNYTPSGYDGSVILRSYDGYDTEIVVPKSVTYEGKTYAVTIIGDSALSYGQTCLSEDPTSIVIPDTVRELQQLALSGNSITSIDLPAKLEYIDEYAFAETKLTSIELPATVWKVGKDAFSGCMDLKDIYVERAGGSTSYDTRCFGYYWDDDALAYSLIPDVTIHGYPGSKIETYANNNGIAFAASSTGTATLIDTINVTAEINAPAYGDTVYQPTITINYVTDMDGISIDPSGLTVAKWDSGWFADLYMEDGEIKGYRWDEGNTFDQDEAVFVIWIEPDQNGSGKYDFRHAMIQFNGDYLGTFDYDKDGYYIIAKTDPYKTPHSYLYVGRECNSGASGTVNLDGSAYSSSRGEYVAAGSSHTISAKADEGSRFAGWKKGSSSGDIFSQEPTITVTANDEDESYYAVFVKDISAGTLCSTVDYTFDASTGTLTLIPTGYDEDEDEIYGAAEVAGGYGSSPFCGNPEIRHIVLQEGMRSMWQYVFHDNNNIETVSLPKTFRSIHDRTFEDCRIIGDGFTVASGNTLFKALPEGSLVDFDGTELIKIALQPGQTDYAIPDGITSVWSEALEKADLNRLTLKGDELDVCDYAFDHCTFKEIIIEEGVRNIYGYQRLTNYAESIMLPSTLRYIDPTGGIIDGPNIKNIYAIANGLVYESFDGVPYEKKYDGEEQVGRYLFRYPVGRTDTSFTVPDDVTGISQHAFTGIGPLKEITLPANVAEISYRSFAYLDGITVTIKNPDCEIDNYAFEESTNVTIKGYTGSTAQIIAEENGFTFEAIGSGGVIETLPNPTNLRWDGTTIKWDPIPGVEGVRYNVKFYEDDGPGGAEPYHVDYYDRTLTDGETEWNEFIGRMAYADEYYYVTVQASKSGYYSSEVVWSPAGHGPFTKKEDIPVIDGDTLTFHSDVTTNIEGVYYLSTYIYVYDMDENALLSDWNDGYSETATFNLRSFFSDQGLAYSKYKIRAELNADYYGWSQWLNYMPEDEYLVYDYTEIPEISKVEITLPDLTYGAPAHTPEGVVIKTWCGDKQIDGMYEGDSYWDNLHEYKDTAEDIDWSYSWDKIEKGKYLYSYVGQLRKYSGYKLSSDVEVYVNGTKAEIEKQEASYIKYRYVYPEDTQPLTLIDDAEISSIKTQIYTGKAIKPTVTVKLGEDTLKSGTDYTVSYKNNTKVGTATVTVKGKGEYKGSISKTFKIVKPTITLSESSYTYDGKAKKPTVTVKVGSTKLTSKSYTVSYASGRKKVGKYSVKITFKGNYEGTKTVYFKILPKKPVISDVTVGTAKMTVKMKTKVSSTGGTYYQIKYRVKGTTKWSTKNTKNQNLTIKSLKKGKVYQVKVRAYKTVSGTKYYSAWSAIKTTDKVK